MRKINKFMKLIDIYGVEVKLTIDKKQKINTICGGAFTIVTLLCTIAFAWFIGNDILYKTKPLSYFDLKVAETFTKINLSKNYFPIAVGLTDLDSNPINDNSLVEISFIKKDYILNNETNSLLLKNTTNVELILCLPEHFPTISEAVYKAASLPTYYCPKYDNLYVEGYWTEETLSYLSYSIKKCDYDLFPKKCKTKKEIDEFISANTLNYNILIVENILSVGNYETPIVPIVSLIYKFLHGENLKITNFQIQNNFLITDNAFFSENNEETKISKMVELQTDLLKIDEKTKEMAQMNIYSSNRSEMYYRKYIKISDILASLGGLIKVFMTVFTIMIKPFNFLKKFKSLFKHLKDNEICENNLEILNSRNNIKFKIVDLNHKNSKIINKSNNNLIDGKSTKEKKKNLNINVTKKELNLEEKNINNDNINNIDHDLISNEKKLNIQKQNFFKNENKSCVMNNNIRKKMEVKALNIMDNKDSDISEVGKINHKSSVNLKKHSDYSKPLNKEIEELNVEIKQNKFSLRNLDFKNLTNFKMIKGFITDLICKKKNNFESDYKKLKLLNSKLLSFFDCTSLITRLIDIDYYISSKKSKLINKENNSENK